MTSADIQPARNLRALAMVASCVMPLLAACSSTVASVPLPPKPHTTTAAAVVRPAPLTPRQQVIAALTGYTAAVHAAISSGNAATARRLVSPYLSGARVDDVLETARSIWAKHETAYGEDVVHILSVRVVGDHAFVHDCDNTSGSGLEVAATGQPVPGTSGVPHLNIVTRLDRVHGRWIVDTQVIEDVPCKP